MLITPLIPPSVSAATLTQVAALIYHTDTELFRLLFGPAHRAIPLLERLILGMHNSFSHQYIHVAISQTHIAGITILIPPTPIREDDFVTLLPWHALARLAIMRIALSPIFQTSDKTTPYIQNISVADGFRGQGIGGQLIDYATQLTQKHGYQSIALDVSLNNSRAQQLYQCQGFVVTHTMRIWPLRIGVNRMHKSLH